MEPETNLPFEQFFASRIKERGISLKKLSDTTGITASHIESLLRGDFEHMPSAPYFRGYLLRLGEVLDFDGEAWWSRIKKEGLAKNSGASDTLPHNRFLKQAPPNYLWAIAAGALILIYLLIQAPRIFGKPTVVINFPDANPYATNSSTITLTGMVKNADTLYLNDTQEINIAPDGTWQQTVLLGAGPNPFKISAKKFLGGEADVTEQVIYEPSGQPLQDNGASSSTPAGSSTSSASSPSSSPSSQHSSTTSG